MHFIPFCTQNRWDGPHTPVPLCPDLCSASGLVPSLGPRAGASTASWGPAPMVPFLTPPLPRSTLLGSLPAVATGLQKLGSLGWERQSLRNPRGRLERPRDFLSSPGPGGPLRPPGLLLLSMSPAGAGSSGCETAEGHTLCFWSGERPPAAENVRLPSAPCWPLSSSPHPLPWRLAQVTRPPGEVPLSAAPEPVPWTPCSAHLPPGSVA